MTVGEYDATYTDRTESIFRADGSLGRSSSASTRRFPAAIVPQQNRRFRGLERNCFRQQFIRKIERTAYTWEIELSEVWEIKVRQPVQTFFGYDDYALFINSIIQLKNFCMKTKSRFMTLLRERYCAGELHDGDDFRTPGSVSEHASRPLLAQISSAHEYSVADQRQVCRRELALPASRTVADWRQRPLGLVR